MGASRDNFMKCPRTPCLHDAKGTDSDKYLVRRAFGALIADTSPIGPSAFDSVFDNPLTGRPDNLMEGLCLRTETDGHVTGRAKLVRPEFVEKVKQSEHWQHQAMVVNGLTEEALIWE
jgi:hypothetical protein